MFTIDNYYNTCLECNIDIEINYMKIKIMKVHTLKYKQMSLKINVKNTLLAFVCN